MVECGERNVARQITKEDRERLNSHSGAVIWFTGLSASGKTTLALAIENILFERRCRTYVLDGDNIRRGLSEDLGFSPEDRHENIRRIAELTHLFVDSGIIVITAFISPYRADRALARKLNADCGFIEVYCKCPLGVCEQRDPKGLYTRARAGEIKELTGLDAPYEEPSSPEIIVFTDREAVCESVNKVIRHLEEAGMIPKER